MKKRIGFALTAALVAPVIAFLATAGNAAPRIDVPQPGPPPCWCIAHVDITKSPDCTCSLQIVDISWIASPNCAVLGEPGCPLNSNKKCQMNIDFGEYGGGTCTGYWPGTFLAVKCGVGGIPSMKSLNLSCGGSTTAFHTVTLSCDPCQKI